MYVHDITVCGLSFLLAWWLRVGTEKFLDSPIALPALIFVSTFSVAMLVVGLNGGVWRYASNADLIAILRVSTITVAIFSLIMFLIDRLDGLPRSVPIVSWLLLVAMLSGPRFMFSWWRRFREKGRRKSQPFQQKNVLLIGAGREAEAFLRSVGERPDMPYRVSGLIDERGRRIGRIMRGKRILGDLNNLDAIIDAAEARGTPIDCLVVTKPRDAIGQNRLAKIADIAFGRNLGLLRLPDAQQARKDDLSEISLLPKPFEFTDLLERGQITLEDERVWALIHGQSVIVTGAGGSIGSELCWQIVWHGPKRLMMIDSSESSLHAILQEINRSPNGAEIIGRIGDVRDQSQIQALFETFQPSLVVHAAALKHVPIVEQQPAQGLLTNVIGTRNVADAAAAAGAKAMVLISTDKAIDPTSVMGASKRIAEMYCQALDLTCDTRFVTVRFGNVLGSAGSVVPLFEEQIRAGGPVTVTHPDIERYFMTVSEAVQLVLHATQEGINAKTAERGWIYVLDMGKPVKIVDIARRMIQVRGLKPDMDILIQFVGLRPGEKLKEELFASGENLVGTHTKGVLKASPRIINRGQIDQELRHLESILAKGNERDAVNFIEFLVPEYRASAQYLQAVPTSPPHKASPNLRLLPN